MIRTDARKDCKKLFDLTNLLANFKMMKLIKCHFVIACM